MSLNRSCKWVFAILFLSIGLNSNAALAVNNNMVNLCVDDNTPHNTRIAVCNDACSAEWPSANKHIEICNKAILLDQNNPLNRVNLGYALIDDKRYLDAVEVFRQLLPVMPEIKTSLSTAYYYSGVEMYKKANFTDAIKQFKESIRFDGTTGEPHNALGSVLSNQGRYYEAIDEFKEAININPDLPHYYMNLADAYRSVGEIDLARPLYLRALQMEPSDPTTLLGISEFYQSQQNYIQAITVLEKAISEWETNEKYAIDNNLMLDLHKRIDFLKEKMKSSDIGAGGEK